MQTEELELISFTTAWDEAMVTNDANQIGKFMSDDWIIIGSDGTTSKTSFLHSISSGALTLNRMDSDKLDVRIYGKTGIIISRGTSAGTYKGESFSFYEWSTSVFLKTKGNWLCVLTMITPSGAAK